MVFSLQVAQELVVDVQVGEVLAGVARVVGVAGGGRGVRLLRAGGQNAPADHGRQQAASQPAAAGRPGRPR
jgi:hypothetical protein